MRQRTCPHVSAQGWTSATSRRKNEVMAFMRAPAVLVKRPFKSGLDELQAGCSLRWSNRLGMLHKSQTLCSIRCINQEQRVGVIFRLLPPPGGNPRFNDCSGRNG